MLSTMACSTVQLPAEVTCMHFSNIKISLELIGKQICAVYIKSKSM